LSGGVEYNEAYEHNFVDEPLFAKEGTSLIHEKTRLLVKVSALYYLDGMNQQEISKKLGISRPQVSRMLAAAKAEGIVQITIKNPFSEEQAYERAIEEAFGIADSVVVNGGDADRPMVELMVARAAAALLENVIKDGDVVGVMAGRTVGLVGAEMTHLGRKDVRFVPLVGGWGADGAAYHANSNTRTFAERARAKHYLLNAPAIVGSEEAKTLFVREREIGDVLQLARRCAVAVVGIGPVSEEASVVRSGYFDKTSIDEVAGLGAVSNLCTSFLNAQGEPVAYEAERRMIGLAANELRGIPNVIAAAVGEEKAAAIAAALRGRYVDALVTDMDTAKRVLAWHQAHPFLA